MSIYIHIPFCTKICSYCDFPKVFKNDEIIGKYLDSLEIEIRQTYKNEKVDTLYIGGGTPTCLNIKHLKRLLNIVKELNLDKDAEITIEANSEDLNEEKLKLIKPLVNRLSIGVQTFDKNRLKKLNRSLNVENIKKAQKYIKNINLDLMYGLDGQTLEELKRNLDKLIKLNPTHISAYSLIIEPNTLLYINNIKNAEEDIDRKMYEYIEKTLKEKGYTHYEISNYAKRGYESKHNLTYWNNEEYYGFGLGASGYVNGVRYDSSKSITEYLKNNFKRNIHKLTKDEKFQNEFILGLRKIKGIEKLSFKKKYNVDIKSIKEVKNLLKIDILKEDIKNIYINPKYTYLSNEVLINFIDISLPET